MRRASLDALDDGRAALAAVAISGFWLCLYVIHDVAAEPRTVAPRRGRKRWRGFCGRRSACCCRSGLRCSGNSRCDAGWSNGRLVPPPSRHLRDLRGAVAHRRTAAPRRWRRCARGRGLCLRRCCRHDSRRDHRLFGAAASRWSIRPCRRCARSRRSPGCRCSSCGSASSRRRRSS